MLKEYCPELKDLMEFEALDDECESQKTQSVEIVENIEVTENEELNKIDLLNPSEELLNEAEKIKEEYKITPELANQHATQMRNSITKLKEEKSKTFFDAFIKGNASRILAMDDDKKTKTIAYLQNTILPICK